MNLRNFLVTATLAGSTCMLVTWAAHASAVDRCGGDVGSCAVGSISVYKDVTYWNLTIIDSASDANCAYAKVTIDRNNLPDPVFRSPNACPKGDTRVFRGDVQYSGTRGARVEVCIDRNSLPDRCTNIHYEYEIE
jgi:hypothetical protein